MIAVADASDSTTDWWQPLIRRAAFWSYIATLAWAPFPLGSDRQWAWNLLTMLVALCWMLWGLGNWADRRGGWQIAARYPWTVALGLLTIIWAVLQVLPWMPASWVNPLWSVASNALKQNLPATISVDPWRTMTELLKLVTYVMVLWLTFAMARDSGRAGRLLNAIIGIGTFYGLYAIVLKAADFGQFQLFYSSARVVDPRLSGPFVSSDSYAAFEGLCTLAALVGLFSLARSRIVAHRGMRPALLSGIQFLMGAGLGYLLAFLICFSTLIASASRAGIFATLCAMFVMLIVSLFAAGKSSTRTGLAIAGLVAFILIAGLIGLNGDVLGDRLGQLVDVGNADAIRLELWGATQRMIADSPFLGFGLGTFQDVYPLYASQVFPYLMDKAHCDYLEFAAGLGLPAAIAWWIAWFLLVVDCVRGVFWRKRDKHFALLAVGASVLVAIQSAVDFNLQIPAVSFLCATLIGLGLAQSRSSRSA